MGVVNFMNSAAGNRSAKRARVLLAGRLETPKGEIEVRLRDISRKGALVECTKGPSAGTEVTFVRGRTRVPARVAWAGKDRIGLEFDELIDEQEVLVQLKRRDPPLKHDVLLPGRPPINGMSAKERKLAEAWGVNVGLVVPD